MEAGQLGERLGEELLLYELGDHELLFHPLPAAGLVLLFLNELADLHRRRGVGRERVEELPIVGRVAALGEPRAEGEQSDQLTRRNERHGQHHAGLAHLVERRRLELQRRDVDGGGRALEVRHEGVVRGDLEFLGLHGRHRSHLRRLLWVLPPAKPGAAPASGR